MRRGRSQVLFKYLPECVVDHADTQTIAIVTKWNTKSLENFNKTRIVAELGRRLSRYPKKRTYPQSIASDEFIFLKPLSIEVELFPLTLLCKKCKKAYSFDNIGDFRRAFRRSNYSCTQKGCGGKLEQMDLIHYHKCGKIQSLKVRKCPNHGFENIVLVKNGSDQPGNWRWHCAICNMDTGIPVEGYCQDCQEKMDTAPFRKSQVFYPHSFTLINTAGFSESRYYSDIGSYKLLLAAYLGLVDTDNLEKLMESSKENAKAEEYKKISEKLRKKGIPEELVNEMIAEVRKTFGEDDSFTIRTQALKSIEAKVPLPEDQLRTIGMAIQEFRETIGLAGIKTISNILKEAQDRRDPNWSKIALFPKRLENIGVLNAYVVSDLPILSAVYGYSRVTAHPSECVLRSFVDMGYPGKTPVYINATETEGIILEFDRGKILKWLKLNGVIQSIPILDDEPANRSWFLNNIDPSAIPIFEEVSSSFPITKIVYKLLHSMSHVLLRTAAGLSGLDKDSLGEIILPNIPAILIYANNIHDYQIGGIHTLFESSNHPLD